MLQFGTWQEVNTWNLVFFRFIKIITTTLGISTPLRKLIRHLFCLPLRPHSFRIKQFSIAQLESSCKFTRTTPCNRNRTEHDFSSSRARLVLRSKDSLVTFASLLRFLLLATFSIRGCASFGMRIQVFARRSRRWSRLLTLDPRLQRRPRCRWWKIAFFNRIVLVCLCIRKVVVSTCEHRVLSFRLILVRFSNVPLRGNESSTNSADIVHDNATSRQRFRLFVRPINDMNYSARAPPSSTLAFGASIPSIEYGWQFMRVDESARTIRRRWLKSLGIEIL